MTDAVERFLKYVRIDTRSDPSGEGSPSSTNQLDLARVLVEELNEIGLQEVNLDENGFVTAVLPGNVPHTVPVIAWIAHLDTSPDYSGKDVRPRIVEKYDGGDIVLDAVGGVVLSPRDFPELLDYTGQTLITTDGSTLLGADDKAGVAEIMAAVEHLVRNPSIPHGTLKVAFTPDEETGKGADRFDAASLGADFAFTLDGGPLGEINFENFNAASAKITFQGRSVHPGSAKGKMVNALQVAFAFHSLLPAADRPEMTEDYEGFFHPVHLTGAVDAASLSYIIRDHDRQKFEARKALALDIAGRLNAQYGAGTVHVEIKDQYFNMKEKIEPVMHIVETAKAAMLAAGVTPLVVPIRGGTDGARFSFNGLPTPNLFAGGHNFHGRYEYIPTASMHKAVEVILKIVELTAQAG